VVRRLVLEGNGGGCLEVVATHRDTISMAIVTKSRRKGLLVTSTDKRGRLCRKEKGIESSNGKRETGGRR